MATLLNGPVEPYSLPAGEAEGARESSEAIANLVGDREQPVTLRLVDPSTGRHVETTLSAAVLRLLTEALAQMAGGRAVTLMPLDAELSTQQAADLLGVSRPYFVKLLEEGRLPFRKVGSQRRVRFDALRRYMEEYQREATEALEAMSAEAQKLGLYE